MFSKDKQNPDDFIVYKKEEAQKKITQINELNSLNSEAIKLFPLGKIGKTNYQFPDKFSQDIGAILLTCEIQKMLIDYIKLLLKQKSDSNTNQNKIINDFKIEEADLRKKLQQAQNSKKIEFNKLLKQEQMNQKLKQELGNKRKLENEVRQMKNKIKQLLTEINHQRTKSSKLSTSLNELQTREHNRFKFSKNTFQILSKNSNKVYAQPVNHPLIFANSDQRKQILIKSALKDFHQFREKSEQSKYNQAMAQNHKLREWIKRFISAIQNILKVRLQKLRQTGQSEQEIFINFRYLNKMHLNVIYAFEKEEFPFAQMLNDFQIVVKQADQNKLKLDHLNIVNQAKLLERQTIMEAIDSLRKYHSAIIQEFSMVGAKRKELAEQYKKIIKPNLDAIQWIEKFSVDEVKNLLTYPKRILNEVQRQYDDFKRNIEGVKKNLEYVEPEYVGRMDCIKSQAQNFIVNLKDSKLRTQQKQQLFAQLRTREETRMHALIEQFLMNDFESARERQKRQRQQYLETAKIMCQEKFKRLSVTEELKRLEEELSQGRDPELVRDEHFSSIRNGANYGAERYPQDQFNRERENILVRQIMYTQQKNRNKQQEDVQI